MRAGGPAPRCNQRVVAVCGGAEGIGGERRPSLAMGPPRSCRSWPARVRPAARRAPPTPPGRSTRGGQGSEPAWGWMEQVSSLCRHSVAAARRTRAPAARPVARACSARACGVDAWPTLLHPLIITISSSSSAAEAAGLQCECHQLHPAGSATQAAPTCVLRAASGGAAPSVAGELTDCVLLICKRIRATRPCGWQKTVDRVGWADEGAQCCAGGGTVSGKECTEGWAGGVWGKQCTEGWGGGVYSRS